MTAAQLFGIPVTSFAVDDVRAAHEKPSANGVRFLQHPVDHGTVVTLIHSAGAGSAFAGWGGDADCADGQVTMDTDVSCTATFALDTHTLDVSLAGTG